MNAVFVGVFGNGRLMSAFPTEIDANNYIRAHGLEDVIFRKQNVVVASAPPAGKIMECM